MGFRGLGFWVRVSKYDAEFYVTYPRPITDLHKESRIIQVGNYFDPAFFADCFVHVRLDMKAHGILEVMAPENPEVVSPLIVMPYITPIKEFRVWLI